MNSRLKIKIVQREIKLVENHNVKIFKETRNVLRPNRANKKLQKPKISIVKDNPRKLRNRKFEKTNFENRREDKLKRLLRDLFEDDYNQI